MAGSHSNWKRKQPDNDDCSQGDYLRKIQKNNSDMSSSDFELLSLISDLVASKLTDYEQTKFFVEMNIFLDMEDKSIHKM